MLDPFKECPYLILGLPLFVRKDAIVDKWRVLILSNHPDKNHASDISTMKAQILNSAKERALLKYNAPEIKYAVDLAARISDEETEQMWTEAEEKRVVYESLWMEQRRAGQQREANDKAEIERMDKISTENDLCETQRIEKARMENDLAETLRIDKVQTENDLAETQRMEAVRAENEHSLLTQLEGMQKFAQEGEAKCIRAEQCALIENCDVDLETEMVNALHQVDEQEEQNHEKTRKHWKVWGSQKFKDLQKLIQKFVVRNIQVKQGSFTPSKEIIQAFKHQHSHQTVDPNFFSRQFGIELKKTYNGATIKKTVQKKTRGYIGLSVVR